MWDVVWCVDGWVGGQVGQGGRPGDPMVQGLVKSRGNGGKSLGYSFSGVVKSRGTCGKSLGYCRPRKKVETGFLWKETDNRPFYGYG